MKTDTYLGVSCKRGHDGTRYASDGHCVECSRAKALRRMVENHDKHLETARRWRALNPGRRRESEREWRITNRKRKNELVKSWRGKNPERVRAMLSKRRSLSTKLNPERVLWLLEKQRGKCACCRRDLEKYHVDHIVPIKRGGDNDDKNLQLLCPTCNLQKHAKDPIRFMQERGFLL